MRGGEDGGGLVRCMIVGWRLWMGLLRWCGDFGCGWRLGSWAGVGRLGVYTIPQRIILFLG